jgi:hypothetical protein
MNGGITMSKKISKEKRFDPIPEEFNNYDEAAEFWNTHDTMDYPDTFRTIKVVSKFKGRHYKIELEEDIIKALKIQARKKGITPGELATNILRQKLINSKRSHKAIND